MPIAAGSTLISVNGQPLTEVSALDRALHYGDGLFETIGCTGGQARLLPLHLERLSAGCQRLGIAPGDTHEIGREISALAAPVSRCVIKLLVTRGSAAARGYAVSVTGTATRVTLRYPWPVENPQLALHGVRVRTATTCLGAPLNIPDSYP